MKQSELENWYVFSTIVVRMLLMSNNYSQLECKMTMKTRWIYMFQKLNFRCCFYCRIISIFAICRRNFANFHGRENHTLDVELFVISSSYITYLWHKMHSGKLNKNIPARRMAQKKTERIHFRLWTFSNRNFLAARENCELINVPLKLKQPNAF